MRLLVAALGSAAALLCPAALSQTPSVTWQHVVAVEGDRGEVDAIAITENGNIVVAGSLTQPVDFNQGEAKDAWLAMYAPDGTQLWSRQFGGDYRDDILDVAIDAQGSIIVAGNRDTFYRQSRQSANAFAAKFDQAGGLVWDTVLADESRRITIGEIAATRDGGILLSGQQTTVGDGGSVAVVFKLTPDGRISWASAPASPPISQLPGFTTRKADGRQFASDRASIALVNRETAEIRVKRSALAHDLDAGCVVLGLADGQPRDALCSAASLNGFTQGSIYSGWRTQTFELADPVIRKADHSGGVVWERILTSAGGDGFFDVAPTPDGGVVGAGFRLNGERVKRHNWDGLLVRLDADGHELWRRTFGGNKREELKAVEVLEDGTIIVAGFTGSQTGVLEWAPWIMRLNSQGELEGDALKELQDRQF
jgi:uncharacterized delta-60 repeat protein